MQSGCINHHYIGSYACPPFNTAHAQNRPNATVPAMRLKHSRMFRINPLWTAQPIPQAPAYEHVTL